MKRLLFVLTALLMLNFTTSTALADWFLPQTGQTTCYDSNGAALPSCANTGQDGDLRTGAAWPDPRFTDNANGTITDNLTGLIWLKNANCFGAQPWETALASARGLATNACDLNDGSTVGQWRLPSIVELESLVNEEQARPDIWLNTQGFTAVQGNFYWSGTTYAYYTNYAWFVGMSNGYVSYSSKTNGYYVWPVRSGN